jgi:tetratricopeptide (TPR) repeat protein
MAAGYQCRDRQPLETSASMANPLLEHFSGAARRLARALVLIPLAAVALGAAGCSINLSSLSPSAPEKEETAAPAVTPTSSIGTLNDAIKNEPNDPRAYNTRGLVLAQAGKTEEALADFNAAIRLDPNFGQAFANRAMIYRKTNRLDAAMADYDRAIALDASYAPAHLGRGIVHRAKSEPIEALEDFNKAISLRPDVPRPITTAACCTRAKSSMNMPSLISPRPAD